jgi:hypothetical protein
VTEDRVGFDVQTNDDGADQDDFDNQDFDDEDL